MLFLNAFLIGLVIGLVYGITTNPIEGEEYND